MGDALGAKWDKSDMISSPARASLAFVLLTGCVAEAPAPATPAAPYPPAQPVAPAADPRSIIALPFSTTTSPVPAGVPRVLVSRQAIMLEGDGTSYVPLPPPDRWTSGVEASYKRNGPNDLYLVPLGAALERAGYGDGRAVAIGFDAAIPYRVVVEVLYTAGQSRYGTFHLLTRTAAGFGAVVTRPPSVGGHFSRPINPTLNLAVLITSGGLAVKTSFGNIAPGCAGIGPGIALPRGGAGLDLAGLRACAASLKQRDPRFAQETQAVVVANPDVPFGEVVAVMDALRVDPVGRVAYPDIHFGVPR